MARRRFGEYGYYVGGRTEAAAETFEVLDPATNEPIADVAEGGREGIEDAVAAATDALPEWRSMDPSERGQVLRDAADAVRDATDRLAEIETAETGKPLSQSRMFGDGAADYFDYYAGLADKIQGETIPLGEGYLDYTRREPLGVTGQIIPWNVPSLLSLRGIAPALVCGNAVVAKPAPEAPLTVLEMTRIVTENGLPDGVWNTVPGDGPTTGAALTASDGVDKVVFTGSAETAKVVMKSAAESLTPVGLETGGKSPSVVFPDATLDDAVADALNVFHNAGQVCFATTRIFVHADVYDEFAERVTDGASALTIGPGAEDPDLGPLITRQARDAVAGEVSRAVDRDGGRVLTGGDIPREEGNFYKPTIIDDVPDDARISCEEVFGPVFTLHEFESEREVVRRANDTKYGLYATVYTNDLSRAHRVAGQIEAGTVAVNEFPVTRPQAPFGGYKESGLGREKGVQAIEEYTQLKNVIVSLDDC